MKKLLFFLIVAMLIELPCKAQEVETRGKYLGIDVINSLPSYVFPEKYYIRKTIIIEPYYRFETKNPERSFLIGAGYSKGSTHTYSEFDPSQNFKGAYFKVLYEIKATRKFISVGYGPMISFAGYDGKFHFDGPTFGDYEGSFSEKNNFALGSEIYAAYDLKLNSKLSLRFLIKNVAGRRTKSSVYVQYYPGFGYTPALLNNRFLYSGGLSFQLYYKIR